ncbi:MAG: hypothetical protein IKG01_03435 [Lachnospiraceae bacterium]|nr:hypothetical protein [Lachnospiraceae bacterium]
MISKRKHRAPGRRVWFGIILGLLLTARLCVSAEIPEDIHLPLIEACEESPTGLKTTWSCVWFGRYPSAEVVDSAWSAVDDYALDPGDVIRDAGLYERLTEADWQGDTVVLDGIAYRRVGLDRAAGQKRAQHYGWAYDRPWHYFEISPIRWRVLDVQGERALLLADRMIDCVPFNAADEDVAWQDCTLRSWLNGYGGGANRAGMDFAGKGLIDLAFTDREREAILTTLCENADNSTYGTDSGEDTRDKLFILSNSEVFESETAGRYGFEPNRDHDDPARRFTSTLYAKLMGTWWSPVEDYAGNSFWCMRTSGYTSRSVTYVCDFGYIYSKGALVNCADAGVLPAMWVDLRAADVEYAAEAVSTDIIHAAEQGNRFPVPQLSNPVRVADEAAPGGSYTVWNAVSFGHYPQTEVNRADDAEVYAALAAMDGNKANLDGVEYVRRNDRWFRCDAIIWRVLEVEDGTALLMANQCLDSVPFHRTFSDVGWEDSDLRKWLNDAFVEEAFTQTERRGIAVSTVHNNNNYYFGTGCGSGTRDQVFILSEEETFSSDKAERYGFARSDAAADGGRCLSATDYAAACGAWRSGEETGGNCFWFLRTNGYTQDNVVYVGEKGYLYNRGISVTCSDAGIVPVIRVQLGYCPLMRVENVKAASAS